MKRLRKLAEAEDEMTIEELSKELYDAISFMETHTNEWAVRDNLIKFTTWGFYQGEAMASIDQEAAMEIIDQLKDYVDELINSKDMDTLYEIDDIIGRYAHQN